MSEWESETYQQTILEVCLRLEDERLLRQKVECGKNDALVYLNRAIWFVSQNSLHFNDSNNTVIVKPVGDMRQHRRMMETPRMDE